MIIIKLFKAIDFLNNFSLYSNNDIFTMRFKIYFFVLSKTFYSFCFIMERVYLGKLFSIDGENYPHQNILSHITVILNAAEYVVF